MRNGGAPLLLLVLKSWQIFASESKVQSRRTFVSICSPERTFFALKFVELLVDCSREMLAGRFCNRCALNHRRASPESGHIIATRESALGSNEDPRPGSNIPSLGTIPCTAGLSAAHGNKS
jgi:hypothetical protein